MHNLFLVYFVNLYMFRAYLGPSSGGTTLCIQQLVLIILFQMTVYCLVGQESNQHNRRLIIIIIISTICIHTVVPPDDGPRYAQNMQRLTKYTKNKLCIKLVFPYTIPSDHLYGQTSVCNLMLAVSISCQMVKYCLRFYSLFMSGLI